MDGINTQIVSTTPMVKPTSKSSNHLPTTLSCDIITEKHQIRVSSHTIQSGSFEEQINNMTALFTVFPTCYKFIVRQRVYYDGSAS